MHGRSKKCVPNSGWVSSICVLHATNEVRAPAATWFTVVSTPRPAGPLSDEFPHGPATTRDVYAKRTGPGSLASSAPVIDHEHARSIVPGSASLHRDALKCRSKPSRHHRAVGFLAGHVCTCDDLLQPTRCREILARIE